MTAKATSLSRHEVFVRRRFFALFLPIIAAGSLIFLVASATTLTVNGGSIFGWGIAGLGIFAAARDAGGRE